MINENSIEIHICLQTNKIMTSLRSEFEPVTELGIEVRDSGVKLS